MFNGYCFVEAGGRYKPAVKLCDQEEAWTFIAENKNLYPEVRIVDKATDDIVIQAKGGRLIFPLLSDYRGYYNSMEDGEQKQVGLNVLDKIELLIGILSSINNQEAVAASNGGYINNSVAEMLAREIFLMGTGAPDIFLIELFHAAGFTVTPTELFGSIWLKGSIATAKGIVEF